MNAVIDSMKYDIKIAFTKANGTYDRNFNPDFSLTWWSRDRRRSTAASEISKKTSETCTLLQVHGVHRRSRAIHGLFYLSAFLTFFSELAAFVLKGFVAKVRQITCDKGTATLIGCQKIILELIQNYFVPVIPNF